jgi:GNAT superfamily N-acetyltransferase
MDPDGNGVQLFRASVHRIDAIVAAGTAIERLALGHGIDPLQASRFRFMVEELCTERILTAFGPEEEPAAFLVLELRPGELAVVIQDAGSPIDAATAAAGAKGWLAQLLGRGFADRLHASFEGREGNRCEILKSLDKSAQAELRNSAMVPGSATKAEVEADVGPPQSSNIQAASSIQYRDMLPADALEVARCFYRTYGLTAPIADELIYHPEKCAAQIRAGLHLGTVATLPSGRIVGHIAVTFEHPNDPVGISGFLVVDPEFRAHGIADRLSDTKPALARKAGAHALLGMAVTVHTASQKTSLREGGHEVGVLLAAQEDRIVMHGIASDMRHERHAIVPFFTALEPDPKRSSFPPSSYRAIIEGIYQACGLERAIGEAPILNPEGLPDNSALVVTVSEGARFAKIRVAEYGRNFVAEIFHMVEDLHRHHVRVIRLEMPLSDPLTAHFANVTEPLGFSFAAIFPAMEPGDLLCLQSLERIDVDPATIHVASDHGSAVLAAVLASRQRVLESITKRALGDALSALQSNGVRP